MSVYQEEIKVQLRTDAAHCEGTTDATSNRPLGELAKISLDFSCALILIVLTAPIVALAAIAVKLTSRGPVFYCQTRTGKDGKPFTIFKIRTMTYNCESLTGARWASEGDPRITWIGYWLRRTHVDELPQLWNVLRGEMSLVGPRPERPEFVVGLEQVFPEYQRRHAVKPGLSGLAQIHLPADSDLESVRRKLVYDLYYVDRGTLWMDIRIILCTVCKVLHIPVWMPRNLLGLPTKSKVEDTVFVVMDAKKSDSIGQAVPACHMPSTAQSSAALSSVS